MQKQCALCSTQFEISNADLAFYDKISPEFQEKKLHIPPPNACPACRQQRRLMFRNERKLFKRTCDFSGEKIVSMYQPDSPFPVYSTDSWWSDAWDARSYAQEVDFSRPFFEQLNELYGKVPRLQNVGSADMKQMNSEYVNFAGWNKSCYLIFDSDYNEECCYSNVIKHSKFCIDCSYVSKSQYCYECVDCINSYELQHSQRCNNCNSGMYLLDCIGCSDCSFCCNLTKKKNCLWNTQLSKEEYAMQLNSLLQSDHKELADKFREFTLQHPRKYCSILQSEDCTGDYISNAQRCTECFNVGEAQDLRYCDSVYRARDCMDVSSFGEQIEQISNSGTVGHGCFDIHFSYDCVTNCSGLFYCLQCHSTKNSFGCVGFRKGEYCILNKQYTKEEYSALVPKIIEHMQSNGEWGEYFPVMLSPFAYNETVAQEYFPMTKEEVEEKGWKWRDERDDIPKVDKIIPAAKLPKSIDDIPDDILNWAIECEVTRRPFLIMKQELEFYRKFQIPIPRLHVDERYKQRMAMRNPRQLWERNCKKCNKEIQTTYAPERSEIIYCEDCYLKVIY